VSASRVTAIVLAGGRSSRFGSDKLAADVEGRRLLHRAIDAVAGIAAEIVVVVGPGAPEPTLPAAAAVPVGIARDAVGGRGPLAGLAAGLAAAGGELALVVGGDQPWLRPEVLRLLLEELDPGPGDPGPDVAILADGDRIWPFPVAVRVATVGPAAQAALLGPDLRLYTLYRRLRLARVPEARWRALDPGGETLRDVDTPADLPAADPGPFAGPVRTTGPWGTWWRAWYRLLRLVGGPLVRLAIGPGFGNLVVLRVAGRRSGRERVVPLGVLTVGDRRYLGHPSGDTAWTLNLRAAATATIERARIPRTRFRPVLLGPGPERDAVVRASFRQHPFPGNALYRLAGRHVAATGVFFRLEAAPGWEAGPGAGSEPGPGAGQ
jgi:molybdopterin-guanine dinucleotide biosynthesis protein A